MDMSSHAEPLIRKLIAEAAKVFVPSPAVAAGEALYDYLRKREASATAWVARNLPKVTPQASSDEREVGIMCATEALQAAKVHLDHLVIDEFDPARASHRVEKFLDYSLSDKERHVAKQAIRLSLQRFCDDAKNSGDDLRAYARAMRASTDATIEGITALRDDSTPYAPLSQRARNIVAGHRLKDILHHEYYVSDVPGLAIKSLERTWRDRVRESLDEIDTLLAELRVPRKGAEALRGLRLSGPCATSWRELQDPQVREALSNIRRSIAKMYPQEVNGRLQQLLNEIEHQISEPTFSLAFPICGSWGSGKSRLLDRISEIVPSLGWLPVHVEFPEAVTIEAAVMAAFAETLGGRITSPPDLRKALEGRQTVVVIVDDWDVISKRQPQRQRDLESLIERLSDLDIRWVISVDESALPAMLADNGRMFWRRYGVPSEAPKAAGDIVSGWFLLDEANVRIRVGIKIASELSPSEHTFEADQFVGEDWSVRTVIRTACSPLVALLRLRLGASSHLDEVHLASLMDSYWALMQTSLTAQENVHQIVLDTICEAIARGLLEGRSADLDSLVAGGRDGFLSGEWEEAVLSATRTLRDRNILLVVGNGRRLRPSPSSPLLWGFLACREAGWSPIAGENPLIVVERDAVLALASRLGRDDSGLTATALRFMLVSSAASTPPGDANLLKSYLQWLHNPQLPTEMLWEAAPLLPHGIRDRLIDDAVPISRVDPGEAFWGLRMLRLSETPNNAQALRKLEFAARLAGAASAAGLHDYLLLVLEETVGNIDWTRDAHALKGLELLFATVPEEISERLSYSLIAHLDLSDAKRRANWFATLARSLANLSEVSGLDGDELPFWLALTRRSTVHAAYAAGPDVLLEMAKSGFFADGIRGRQFVRPVGHHLRRAAHVAFGQTRSADRNRFDQLVLDLIEGTVIGISTERQAQVALFGIRHTVPTWGGDVSVDSALAPQVTLLKHHSVYTGEMRRWIDSIHLGD